MSRELSTTMIAFERIDASNWHRVADLAVHPEQQAYVGTMGDLARSQEPTFHSHAILENESVVGFFNLDLGYADRYDFAGPNEVGLRAFFIDARHQGRGLGKAACRALKGHLRRHYADRPALVLTVNCRNLGAYRAYRAAGFEDDGELYHGGSAGPQHVMRMPLVDTRGA